MPDRTTYYHNYYQRNKERLRPLRRAAQRKYNERRRNKPKSEEDRFIRKLMYSLDIKVAEARAIVREMNDGR